VTAPTSPSFYLVRHCRATGQSPDASLTAEGMAQAGLLAELLAPLGIARILSSPFARARDSVAPLAARLGIPVETDDRLIERVLTTEPLPDWRAHLARSFDDDNYQLAGGESSHAATARAVAVMEEARQHPARATVVVTHGNLLALLLRHYDSRAGFAAWDALTNPDVYRVTFGVPPQPIVRLWTLTE
jgi:2,3-bisphosphoglycerate-dependent phosphoglycerate mutase